MNNIVESILAILTILVIWFVIIVAGIGIGIFSLLAILIWFISSVIMGTWRILIFPFKQIKKLL